MIDRPVYRMASYLQKVVDHSESLSRPRPSAAIAYVEWPGIEEPRAWFYVMDEMGRRYSVTVEQAEKEAA